MLEILLLLVLTKRVGKIVEQKGRKSGWYKVLTVVLWFGGELACMFVGAIIVEVFELSLWVAYLFALGGAAAGGGIAYLIANILTPVNLVSPAVLSSAGTGPPKETLSRNKKILLGCGIFSLLLICACALVGTLFIAFAEYASREPENLIVEAEFPRTVQAGERFQLVLNIRNTGDTAVTVDQICLDEALSDSILDGAVVVDTEPPMEKNYSMDMKDFYLMLTIPPGETRQLTFYLEATSPGEYGYSNSTIAVYIGDPRAYRLWDIAITVTPK